VLSPPWRSRLRRLLWVRETVLKLKPDIIHAWNLYPMFYLKLAFRSRPCPIIGFLQNVPEQSIREGRYGWMFRFLVTAPDGIVSNSAAALDALSRLGIRVTRSAVVRNGVGSEFFAGPSSAEGRRTKRGVPVVIALGRLIARKRVDWMIRAQARLDEEAVPFDLWLVGDGPERNRLQRLACDLGAQERVVFWGFQSDVPPLLRCADALLHCAWAEGLPNALQEAMACGLPAVAARTSGVPEIVEHQREGLLFDPEDFDGCGAALRRVLTEDSLRRSLGAAARERALRDFQPDRMAAGLLDFYDVVLSQRGEALRR
jgi:glycosyltransferase involved in cell wall biosynthesis